MAKPEELREMFWNDDILNGGYIYNQYREIKNVLRSNSMEFSKRQYKKIKEYAINNTEFYSGFCVNDEFPVLTKQDIISEYSRHKSQEKFDRPLHESSTSGSTGIPFRVIQNYEKRMRHIADLKVFGELCDYPSHECMVYFRVMKNGNPRTAMQEERENIYYYNCINLSNDSLGKMVKFLFDKHPRIVFGYPSSLINIANYIIDNNINLSNLAIKSCLVSGESISHFDIEKLNKAFGCTVYRRYADMECGILGQDFGFEGEYNMNWGSYYFECLKLDSDEPTDENELGRIVITDLYNKAFPIIRYDTGDLGILDRGEKLPKLSTIVGRVRDCLYATNGDLISPATFTVMLHELNNVKQWQLIQNSLTDFELKLNVSGAIDEREIILNLQKILGSDSKINIIIVDEIPVEKSNKRRCVVRKFEKNDNRK